MLDDPRVRRLADRADVAEMTTTERYVLTEKVGAAGDVYEQTDPRS